MDASIGAPEHTLRFPENGLSMKIFSDISHCPHHAVLLTNSRLKTGAQKPALILKGCLHMAYVADVSGNMIKYSSPTGHEYLSQRPNAVASFQRSLSLVRCDAIGPWAGSGTLSRKVHLFMSVRARRSLKSGMHQNL